MIKILKQGTLKKCTCDNCGSVLSYDENEDVLEETVKTFAANCVGGFSKSQKYIICPQCNEKIVLKATR